MGVRDSLSSSYVRLERSPVSLMNSHVNKSLNILGSMYRARWLRGNARDSHSGGPGFESWDWGFSWFSSVMKANAGLDFHYHDPFDHYSPNSYIIKLKSVNLPNETLTTQQ